MPAPAWPFSQAIPGDLIPIGTVLTGSATAYATGASEIMGVDVRNRTGGAVHVVITDTAGNAIYDVDLPDGADDSREWAFRPVSGIKGAGNGVVAHMWGYQ